MAGKTTTIRMICGLLTPSGGYGTCLGYDVLTDSEFIRRHIGYMTQKFSFWEDLTIHENLAFVADMFCLKNSAKLIKKTLTDLGLLERQHQLAGNLSGGWKQRLALAACILHKPDLLLLDEPTAGVDPKARREFWDEIHLLAANGLTVLVTTHYMDEAERCHEIVYIANGRLIIQGTIQTVINNTGLTTWAVKGDNLIALQRQLRDNPAVTSIAPFGDSLHISGTDSKRLRLAIAEYFNQSGLSWSSIPPSMEDAFIHYMTNAKIEA